MCKIALTSLALILPVVAAACTPVDTPSASFGVATRNNMAAQIINPAPPLDDPAAAETSGQRANDAVTRYNQGKVTPLMPTTTSTVSQGMAQ